MSSPRYITRPVVEYDVDHYTIIRHLLDQLFIYISREDRVAIEQDLDAAAIRQGLPHTMMAFMRLTIYVDVEEPEVTSSDTSTTTPGDTVGPAALGQQTTPVDFDTVD